MTSRLLSGYRNIYLHNYKNLLAMTFVILYCENEGSISLTYY